MQLSEVIRQEEWTDLWRFLEWIRRGGRRFLLRNDLILAFEDYCREAGRSEAFRRNSDLKALIDRTQEAILFQERTVLLHRPHIARYQVYNVPDRGEGIDLLSISEYLDLKESIVSPGSELEPERKLTLDFRPFYDYGPAIRDSRKVGQGLRFLNAYMASSLSQSPDRWLHNLFRFLQIHQMDGRQLLIDGRIITDPEALYEAVERARSYLRERDPAEPCANLEPILCRMGFAEGLGDTAGRILETLELLSDLFEEPTPEDLEAFISRIPMISKVLVVSPHGWFGQEGVLGRPDTGGQVVYILDQVKALERELRRSLAQAGLSATPRIAVLTRLIPNSDGTTCHLPREKIYETENCWILRVPFRRPDGAVHEDWISRFEIWPYLQDFALEARREVLGEFGGRPDAVIGNYSDGNLVASLLSEWLGILQINIAHALEKPKYLFSDLYWQDNEPHYHFSLQFTADLIAMNRADFIITSTLQEVVGTPTTVGQYESYSFFTMPGLYKVESGIHLFHPKFNVIPPGVDEYKYRPYYDAAGRDPQITREVEELLFVGERPDVLGRLADPQKLPVFSMARLDRIKNLTGLVDAFGRSETLRERCNLVLVTGKVNPEAADDEEERQEILRMHELLEGHGLWEQVRWLGIQLPRRYAGEVYRVVADRRGLFVQPALFEAFGLTVLEAMSSGLPTFATQFGGPQEIIHHGRNGFLINPTRPELLCGPIEEFLDQLQEDPLRWDAISQAGIQRVQERYRWNLYAEDLLKRAKLYGFWRYAVSGEHKREIDRYCDLLFHLLFLPRARAMLERG